MRSNTVHVNQKRHGLTKGLAMLALSAAIMTSAGAASVASTYQESCAACHDSGALNAPKKGDTATWQKLRKQKGMPVLINSVKGGMIQMPAGGLCSTCDNKDYEALIEFMSK